MSDLRVTPVTLRAARAFIAENHRHNVAPNGWRFGVALRNGSEAVLAVATAGQPVARALDDGYTVEITRVCTLGQKNASSMLYGALCRAAKAMGYRRAITYTLDSESGVSLRAAGFTEVSRGKGGRSWSSKSNGGRYDATLWGERIVPEEGRVRWERILDAPAEEDRCDRIVNNGEGEPTECGRRLPCEYH